MGWAADRSLVNGVGKVDVSAAGCWRARVAHLKAGTPGAGHGLACIWCGWADQVRSGGLGTRLGFGLTDPAWQRPGPTPVLVTVLIWQPDGRDVLEPPRALEKICAISSRESSGDLRKNFQTLTVSNVCLAGFIPVNNGHYRANTCFPRKENVDNIRGHLTFWDENPNEDCLERAKI